MAQPANQCAIKRRAATVVERSMTVAALLRFGSTFDIFQISDG